ncbi:MAG: malate dehydrogenase (oxaloacetate-decarboxylating) [Candidatus Paceibacteria bacterium]|jgi:malate dehydrogenase (oxaloacetate-decarboxylating)
MNINERSEKLHRELRGKIGTEIKTEVKNKEDLAVVYTPGVAHISSLIAEDKSRVYEFTGKANTIAIVSDGSAVLGLGNIGPEAALPVMEGKALILKDFSGVNGVPIVLQTQDTEEIISIVKNIAPGFGGIILEDISAPRCFEIENRLKEELDIPVIHDDQHGIAMVVLAGLINALKLRSNSQESDRDVKIVIAGAGAAGVAIAKILHADNFTNVIVADSRGIISKDRTDLNDTKKDLLEFTNTHNISGSLVEALHDADVFVGVSVGNTVTGPMVTSMKKDPIVFALSNPTPEIDPELAKSSGAFIVATGRSDYPNQLNNALVYPGLMKGALEGSRCQFTTDTFIKVAKALSSHTEPTKDAILPDVFDKDILEVVASIVSSTTC